jgi:hypothetical protein
MVKTHGTPEASAWAETGITVSGVAVASRKSTESWCTICDATAAARAEDDWLSPEMMSTEYFLPPIVSPLASAERTGLSPLVASLSAGAALAVLDYRAHPLTIRAYARKLDA